MTRVAPTPVGNGMLRLVEAQARALLRARQASLDGLETQLSSSSSGSAAAAQELTSAQGDVLVLQSIWLLAQFLVTVASSKVLLLRQDAAQAALHTLAPPGGAAVPPAASPQQQQQPPTGCTPPTGAAAVVAAHVRNSGGGFAAGGGGGNGNGGGSFAPHSASPLPADSASSTREAGSQVGSITQRASLHTLCGYVRQGAALGAMWRSASEGAAQLYADACALATSGVMVGSGGDERVVAPPPAWARHAQVAAAQILCVGHEWGMWDMLGTITLARQVLESVLQLPGVDAAQ
jgi:hypothetical protein